MNASEHKFEIRRLERGETPNPDTDLFADAQDGCCWMAVEGDRYPITTNGDGLGFFYRISLITPQPQPLPFNDRNFVVTKLIASHETGERYTNELLAKIEELTAELNQRIQVCKEMDKIIMEEIGERDEAHDLLDEIASAILGEPIGWTFHDYKWREALEASKTLRQKLSDMRERFLDAAQRYAERRYRAGFEYGKNGKKDKAAEEAASQAFENLLEAIS